MAALAEARTLFTFPHEETIALPVFEIVQQIDEMMLSLRQPIPSGQIVRVLRVAERLQALLGRFTVREGRESQSFPELVRRHGVELHAVLPRRPAHHQLAQGLLLRVEEVEGPHREARSGGGECMRTASESRNTTGSCEYGL